MKKPKKPERTAPPDRIQAQLEYDSADLPLPEGARTRDVLSRRLLFRAGSRYLDVSMERDPGTDHRVLVGQVSDADRPDEDAGGLAAAVQAPEGCLAQAESDPLGEFQVEHRPARPMVLSLRVSDREVIEVPLDRRMTKRIDKDAN